MSYPPLSGEKTVLELLWVPLSMCMVTTRNTFHRGPHANTIIRMCINVSPSCVRTCQLTTFLIVTDTYIRTYIMRIDPSFSHDICSFMDYVVVDTLLFGVCYGHCNIEHT